MAQQKALFLQTQGGDFVIGNRPIPTPGAGEVLIKIKATALNPVDFKIKKYSIAAPFIKEFPAVLGTDASGVIEKVGEGVTRFVKGDRVLFQGFFGGDKATFQEYSLMPADLVAKLPNKISFQEGATIPLCLGTAAIGLYNKKEAGGAGLLPPWVEGGRGKYSGKPVFVLGGSGSVGQYAIQLAKLSGFSPIITTASVHHEELLKGLGATHIVDRKADIVAEVKKITSNPVDLVFDCIGDEGTQKAAFEVSSPKASIVLVQGSTIPKENFGERHVVSVMGNVNIHQELGKSLYSKLTDLLEEGSIVPNKVILIPGGLEGIPAGLDKLDAEGGAGTKLVVSLE